MDIKLSEQAHMLKDSNLFVNPSEGMSLLEKQKIFLVLAGRKQVTEVYSGHWEQLSPNERRTVADDPKEVAALLDALGLSYRLQPQEHTIAATIALDQTVLDHYFDIASRSNNDLELGKLFGYPQTAAEGFIQNKHLDTATQDKVIAAAGLPDYFATFFLSTDHYQEEIATLKEWYSLLEQYGLVAS